MDRLKTYYQNLIPDQKELFKQKAVWIAVVVCIPIVLLLLFLLSTWIGSLTTPKPVLMDDSCYVDYSQSLNSSDCEIELIFNEPVNSGYATIAFYDKNDNLLATEKSYFYADATSATSTFYSVNGEVEFYEIVSYDFTVYQDAGYIWLALLALYLVLWICPPFSILTIATLIGTLRQTCYVYKYNDKEIVVYAGKKKQYIKINGEKYDEHNAHIPLFQTVTLTAKIENGDEYQAVIPKNKKTTLKVNGKLLEPIGK